MKNFLAIYTGSFNAKEKSEWDLMPSEKRKELEAKGVQAWGEWMNTHKEAIVFAGGPLGKTKEINSSGITSITNKMCGYVVVKASSHEEAAKMFIEHPHFSIFPGDGVEVMECLELP